MTQHHVESSTSILQKLKYGLSQWKKFWFEPSDPLMLGIIRLLTAGMLFYNLCIWSLDFEAFFAPDGLQPLDTIKGLYEGSPVFSFWFYVPEPWLWTAHLSCLAIVFLFFTGTATRATSILSYLITISYSQRLPIANFGLDQILGLLCLYLAVGPSGSCLSVDGLIRRFRNRRRFGDMSSEESVARIKSSSATVALRLIQIHLCVIYFWAGFAKLKGDSWFTGEAIWNVIANLEYQTLDLTWMAHVPWLPYLVAHITVIWEVFFCVLVWNRTLRPLVLLIGTGMHFGIGAFLGMWTFGLAMTFCYFAFSNPAAWRQKWNRLFWRKQFTSVLVNPPAASLPAASLPAMATADVPLPPSNQTQPPLPVNSVPVSSVPATTVAAATGAAAGAVAGAALSNARPSPPASAEASLSEGKVDSVDKVTPPPKPNLGPLHGLPGTELLILALRERHRSTLQTYFRNHNVPCRSQQTVDASERSSSAFPPAAILVMASELGPHDLFRLLNDLQTDTSVPILAVVSETLMLVTQHRLPKVAFLQAPVTLKEIHEELIQTMWKDKGGCSQTPHEPNQTDQ
ncbi:MAG: HTTM domain-containing protein [Fuerstiella sp.]